MAEKKTLKLTKTAIDAMVYEGRSTGRDAKDLRWDTELKGFGVRVWPSGKKSFFVNYRAAGRERNMTLGAYGVLTLQQARDMAQQAKVKVLQGKDPLADRQRRADGVTFGQFAEEYLKRHASKKRSGADDEGMLRNHLLPLWSNLPLKAIRRADIAQMHHRIGERKGTPAVADNADRKGIDWKKGRSSGGPYVANRAISLLSMMFNLAKKWGYLPDNVPNPAEGIERYKETERERYVTPEEVRILAVEIDREPNLFVRAAIWGYLTNGVRKTMLLRLQWRHIDFAGRMILFPDTKKGKPFVQPLSSYFEELLRTIPRLSGNPYVFCGARHGKHLVSINKNWEKIRSKVGLNDVRIHDLRHTVITWLANAGYSLSVIGKAVDQTNERTTKRYAHLQLGPAAKVLEAHGRQLKAVLAAKDDAELAAVFEVDARHDSISPSPAAIEVPVPSSAGSR